MKAALLSVTIGSERDVVLARQRARQITTALGFDAQDQTRISTAVSEIARNALAYAGGGVVELRVEGNTAPQVLMVSVIDNGPGITNPQHILSGGYHSTTGMGLGLTGAQRLMDHFTVDSRPGRGTTVVMKKLLPPRAPLVGDHVLAKIASELSHQAPRDVVEEMQQQNQELMRALAELTRRQDELAALNRELEDTNRGVIALYAELDEKADHLRRADEIKGRFISNMSHEFRTPVNSIQALARLLLDGTDGELGLEQKRQVAFIRKAADSLSELVNDLLDLAKVEAGKIDVRPVAFEVEGLFGALRGMLRPLLVSDSVELVFEEPTGLPPLYTDEGKVSQILRNFLSNAVKFTEKGEVRVSARLLPGEDMIAFSVVDTGIGIAAEDQERIFQEFSQIDNPIQRKVKGTGLGLPLCRKLAELLGGSVSVESKLGEGSTFTAKIPILYLLANSTESTWRVEPGRVPVLVVEDSAETILVYEKYMATAGFQAIPACSLREARAALGVVRPKAVVLDIRLRGEDAWSFIAELKRREDTAEVPVVIATTLEDERKGLALGADAYLVKPISRQRLVQTLTRLIAPERVKRVLVVDDEEISRYLLSQHLLAPNHLVSEAATGTDALRLARDEPPDVICLDLLMPDLDGFEVLRELKSDPVTREIPVVVVTSKSLSEEERKTLDSLGTSVVAKDSVSRESALAAVESAMRSAERSA
ncbi:MAG TPA: ATP-binding protein [Candidatus Binatia bacterium]|nr:ATP-binding protein [Candidatus Binatia bacterium]